MAKKGKAIKELRLDLGCGQNKREGFTGVDIAKVSGVDIVCDLFKTPWKWADGSVAEVHSSHFFEHVPQEVRIAWMDEVYRILEVGGKATIICPYYTSVRASQDPTHCWPPISEFTFLYFNKDWRTQNKLDHYPIKSDFDFTYGFLVTGDYQNRSEEARNFAIRHYANVVNDIQVVLVKRPAGAVSGADTGKQPKSGK